MNGKRIRHVTELRWTAELVITENPLCLHHPYHHSHHKSHVSHCKYQNSDYCRYQDTSSVSCRVTNVRTSDLNMKQYSTSPHCKMHSHWLLRVPSANTMPAKPDEGKCVLMLNERTQHVLRGDCGEISWSLSGRDLIQTAAITLMRMNSLSPVETLSPKTLLKGEQTWVYSWADASLKRHKHHCDHSG